MVASCNSAMEGVNTTGGLKESFPFKQLDGMVGQPSLMTVLISLTIKVEERNQDEQQDVNLCFSNFKS